MGGGRGRARGWRGWWLVGAATAKAGHRQHGVGNQALHDAGTLRQMIRACQPRVGPSVAAPQAHAAILNHHLHETHFASLRAPANYVDMLPTAVVAHSVERQVVVLDAEGSKPFNRPTKPFEAIRGVWLFRQH